jgi:hypothetical protein
MVGIGDPKPKFVGTADRQLGANFRVNLGLTYKFDPDG